MTYCISENLRENWTKNLGGKFSLSQLAKYLKLHTWKDIYIFTLLSWRKVMTNLDSIFKSRDITLPTKVRLKAMVFPVVMYGCESWTVKKAERWCFWTVVLEKTLESPLDCKKIQPVYSKDLSWVFFGKNDAKVETPVLWPPHEKSWLIGKDSDAGRDWEQEKGTTENEMAGCHHQLNGREFE